MALSTLKDAMLLNWRSGTPEGQLYKQLRIMGIPMDKAAQAAKRNPFDVANFAPSFHVFGTAHDEYIVQLDLAAVIAADPLIPPAQNQLDYALIDKTLKRHDAAEKNYAATDSSTIKDQWSAQFAYFESKLRHVFQSFILNRGQIELPRIGIVNNKASVVDGRHRLWFLAHVVGLKSVPVVVKGLDQVTALHRLYGVEAAPLEYATPFGEIAHYDCHGVQLGHGKDSYKFLHTNPASLFDIPLRAKELPFFISTRDLSDRRLQEKLSQKL